MRKALIVGIDYYVYANSLYGCVTDACNVKNALERNSDGTPNFGVLCLTSTSDDNLVDRTELKNRVLELFSDDMEIALFYYSGHGYIDEVGGYLVTSECKSGDDGFSLSELMTIVNNSPAKNKIVILDSCNSGIAGKVSRQDAFSRISEGVTILTACSENQYAIEENGSGVYTSLMVDALYGGAANLVGDVTPGSVYAHIDQSLGPWDQRPIFKTNVKEFVSLRKCNAPVGLDNLRSLTDLFKDYTEVFNLDPTFEPTEKNCNEENCRKFAILQKLVSVNLVVPVDAEHMYYAAIESKGCKLTSLGVHYWKLVKKGQI